MGDAGEYWAKELEAENAKLRAEIERLRASAGLIVCNVKHNPGCICARNALEAWDEVQEKELQNDQMRDALAAASVELEYVQLMRLKLPATTPAFSNTLDAATEAVNAVLGKTEKRNDITQRHCREQGCNGPGCYCNCGVCAFGKRNHEGDRR
jgi:hypothetical protein